jgi:predicted N-acetyltransferase YhbS
VVDQAAVNARASSIDTVVFESDTCVVGYHALASGSLDVESAPTRLRRNMPNPLPVVVLGRLAVDETWSVRGVGGGLLKDAVLRSLQAADLIGACALLCHAIDADAKAFHARHGFVESPTQELTMMLGLRR